MFPKRNVALELTENTVGKSCLAILPVVSETETSDAIKF